jgi:hypothetical protein
MSKKDNLTTIVEARKAPRVETNPLKLTDKVLNPHESNEKMTEDLLKRCADKRIPWQDELEREERSLGPRTYYTEIIRRLQKINPKIQAKDGTEGAIALYAPKRYPIDYTAAELGGLDKPPNGEFFLHNKYMTGMEKDWLPEWGHVTLDTSKLPVREKRGWRSVLMTFIRGNVISYQDAVKEFGDPIDDPRAIVWFEALIRYIH